MIRSIEARWRTLGVLAVAVSLAVAVLPGGLAQGEDTPGPSLGDGGVLLLHLEEGSDAFVYMAPDGATSTQPILLDGCAATLDTSGTVLAEVGTIPGSPAGSLGLYYGLGVITAGKGGKGPACARVDYGEGLIFSTAGDLAGFDFSAAELDIEGRFNVTVVAELYAGGALVGTTELHTGQSMPPGFDPGDAEHFEWSNYRWLIDEGVAFDELRLTVSPETPGGSFSVESGGDGTPPGVLGYTESAFTLVGGFDGVVECGESTMTVGDGTITPEATFTRGDDDIKNEDPCSELIGYNLGSSTTATEQIVTFVFETSEAPSWFGEFTWVPEPSMTPLDPTLVDNDGDGTFDGPLMWCSGFSGVDASTGNPLPVMPAGESWCLIAQSSTLLGDGTVQVMQTIYGETDPSFARPK